MRQIGVNLPFSKLMKVLIGINVGIWFFGQVLLEGYGGVAISHWLALYPAKVLFDGAIWQIVTYMFLHTLQVSHILLNMLMLWFMGAELEQKWGSKFFLFYYLSSGIGAAIIYVVGVAIYWRITGSSQPLVVPVVGASGAIFGLMLAYGILFGERVVHFMMLFPMKAKFFVLILGAVEVMTILTNGVGGGEVANLAHLGGLVSGYLTLLIATSWKQAQTRKKAKKKGGGLRLVVDNEKSKDEPRYWN